MVNRSKAKGTAAETAVVHYLREQGFTRVERRTLSGSADKGDIAGIDGTVIEVKAAKELKLGPWVEEANIEAANAGVHTGVVWIKRRLFTDPARWFVVMDGETYVGYLHSREEAGGP